MPSRNCRTRPLSWKIANNEKLAEAVRDGGWVTSWVFTNIIASVDNVGRMEGGKYQLRDMFFPHHPDVSPDDVERTVGILHRCGLVMSYTSTKGVGLIQLPKVGNYTQIRGNISLDSDFDPPTQEQISEWENQHDDKYVPMAIKKPEKTSKDHESFVVVEYWNTKPLPRVKYVTAARQDKLRQRWKSRAFRQHHASAIDKISLSSFCTGDNSTGWKATFDWYIKNDDNWLKAYEGKYDNKDGGHFDKY